MSKFVFQLRDAIPHDAFTDLEVASVAAGSPDSRYGLVKRAMAAGHIISLRRGVYAFGRRYQRQLPNPFAVSRWMYRPSYVSLQSALAYHGWIPEAVLSTTNVSMKRSVSFDTPLGAFHFTRLPSFNYAGVDRVVDGRAIYLMASPPKALVDYVDAYQIDLHPSELFESLRVDLQLVAQCQFPAQVSARTVPVSRRVTRFVDSLNRLLKNGL